MYTTQEIITMASGFTAVCQLQGVNPNDERFTRNSPKANALEKLTVVAEFMQQGAKMSYENTDQEKWYVILRWVPGVGFRFNCAFYDVARAGAPGGAALCMPNRELAMHFYMHPEFLELHTQFING